MVPNSRVDPKHVLKNEILHLLDTTPSTNDVPKDLSLFPKPPPDYVEAVEEAKKQLLELKITVHNRYPKFEEEFTDICDPYNPSVS